MRTINNLGVVFVDDDYLVLDAFKREIKIIRSGWNNFYARSGMSAIEVINDNIKEIDVLVCGIKMPKLSGLDVLRITKKIYPHILRITFSGQLDGETLHGSEKLSDLHICKPISCLRLTEMIVVAYKTRWPKMAAT